MRAEGEPARAGVWAGTPRNPSARAAEHAFSVIAAKTRTAIKSFPVSEDAKPPFSGSHEDELENKSEDPQTSETVNPGGGKEALGEVLMLIVVGLLTLGTAIGLGYIFR